MRQVIIIRKDLDMSRGKLAAQCCHASMAFLSNAIRNSDKEAARSNSYNIHLNLHREAVEWIDSSFTKTVCEAKNRNQLMKAVTIAEDLGLMEGRDFFLIKDNCLTELSPEEVDENGVGRTLTCIGFRPMPDDVAHAISKKFQLLK